MDLHERASCSCHIYLDHAILYGIPPSLRTNVDYIFICKEPKLGNQRRLFEHYAGMFPCFEMFRVVLNKCTKDHGCLVIDNSSNSDKLEDQVYWYRTDLDNQIGRTLDCVILSFGKIMNSTFLAKTIKG
jgi:hypothetical protein